jgi:hypothetical protein
MIRRSEFRPDWYQILYHLAAQHAHRALTRDDEDDRRDDIAAATANARSALQDAYRAFEQLHVESASDAKRVRLTPRQWDTLRVFLEETIEPATALLLAGLLTRPGLVGEVKTFTMPRAIVEEDFDRDDGRAPDPERRHKDRNTLHSVLRRDDATTEELVPRLLEFALASNRSYRVDYNLACFLSGRLSGNPVYVDRALHALARALRRAPASEQSTLASWARKDPALDVLRFFKGFEELVSRYELVPLHESGR